MSSRAQGYATLLALAGDCLLSPASDYVNNRTALQFKCECGECFNSTSFLYQKSRDGKRCIQCKMKLKVDNSDARAEFIRRATEIHGGYYDYTNIPDTFNATEPIGIICPKHGTISITSDSHVNAKAGCNICKVDKITAHTRSNGADFAIKANNVHKFVYNYEQVVYQNAKTAVSVVCHKHGAFEITPDLHLRGTGCSKCTANKPVSKIVNRLEADGIRCVTEKTFADCISPLGNRLRFDVYLPDYNMLVEYDGPQHFGPIRYGTMTNEQAQLAFEKQLEHDEIKNQYCERNSIELVRIPHTIHHPEAYLIKLINDQVTKVRYPYTFAMLNEDVKHICSYIKSFGYDQFAVYGIARGGVMFSIPVAYHFDDVAEYGIVTFQRYDGNDKTVRFDIVHQSPDIPIFVIDDLISSGITMQRAVSALQHKYKKAIIHPIVIFGEENADNVFFIREHPKQWIVFDYEI